MWLRFPNFCGGNSNLSDPLRLRVQSGSIAVEDAVENRGLYRVFVLRLF